MAHLRNEQLVQRSREFIEALRRKGVRLWCEQGTIRYRALKEVLSQAELDCLRAWKSEIILALNNSSAESLDDKQGRHAPLSFSQLAHWRQFRLYERHSLRRVASATRMHGPLSIDALRSAILGIVARHEALRTRVILVGNEPMQVVLKSIDCPLLIENITGYLKEQQEELVQESIRRFVLQPIDVGREALFGVHLLKLSESEHVLVMAMEHMISDGYSLGLLIRDLMTLYAGEIGGRCGALPPIAIQYADYAVWQRMVRGDSLEVRARRVSDRLENCSTLIFPRRLEVPSGCLGRGNVEVVLDCSIKSALLNWGKARGSTLVLAVLTAYVALVLRWCGARETIFQYQIDGRDNPELESTVGYFASVLYLRLGINETDTFEDLLRRVTEEYCVARECADFSFLAAQVPRPSYVRSTRFNWLPPLLQGEDPLRRVDPTTALALSNVRFVYPVPSDVEIELEPLIIFSEIADEIRGGIYFPLNQFSIETMQGFANGLHLVIKSLLSNPSCLVSDISFS